MEAFGEIRIPLVQDTPFFHDLSFEGGYRYSDYSTGISTSTYKLALNWAPVPDIRFRGSYNRAVRAPNVVELFAPQAIGLGLSADPCASSPGTAPQWTQEQCANTGVTAAQYGAITPNSANQYNALLGGNPNLDPETADTYSVGFVFTPSFFRGFSFSADYFDITVEDIILPLSPDLVLQSCAFTGNPEFCSLVNRSPAGSLWIGNSYVVGTTTNIGFLKTSGVDFEGNWRVPLVDWGVDSIGGIDISFQATWLRSLEIDPGIPFTNPDDPSEILATSFDCAGLFGIISQCGTPNPEWRHRLRVTWTTPLDGLGVSLAWRYYGSVDNEGLSTNPYLNGPTFDIDKHIDPQNYFDIAATWRVKDNYTLRFGINNVFDKEPPLIGGTTAGATSLYNGNTYPGVYDALGRYLFMSITADF
jgi:outer membrane receptor protein involved in Fe transport